MKDGHLVLAKDRLEGWLQVECAASHWATLQCGQETQGVDHVCPCFF